MAERGELGSHAEQAALLKKFLTERGSSPDEEPMVKRSREMAERRGARRQISAPRDPDNLSRREKAEKLEMHLKKRSRRARGKVTVSKVNQEYARILEQFLQDQLEKQSIQTKPRPGRYQRYMEFDSREHTTGSMDSEDSPVTIPALFIRGDSIPYADETDEEDMSGKVNSVPLDFLGVDSEDRESSGQLEIHHEKSKSAPHPTSHLETDAALYSLKKPSSTVPPPPPCTPLSEDSRQPSPVPYNVGSGILTTDSSAPVSGHSSSRGSLDIHHHYRPADSAKPKPSPPTSLDIDSRHKVPSRARTPLSDSDMTASRSRSSSSPSKGKVHLDAHLYRRSESVSSHESEDGRGHGLEGRKKKSLFKKARERVSHLLRIKKDSDSPPLDGEEETDKHIKKSKKKKKLRPKPKSLDPRGVQDEADMFVPLREGDVLEDKHIHTSRHLEQRRSQSGGGHVVRVEEGSQTVDVTRPKQKKHKDKQSKRKDVTGKRIDTRWKVIESSDGEGSGFMGRIRRMRSKGKSVKGSKSSHFAEEDAASRRDYERTVSVPAPQKYDSYDVDDKYCTTRYMQMGKDNDFVITDVKTRTDSDVRETKTTQVLSSDNISRHSSHLDIVDHEGQMLERFFFTGDDQLPKNRSFDMDSETRVRQQRIVSGGRITTVQDIDRHQRISLTEDNLDMDGTGDSGEEKSVPFEDLSEQERDEVYEKIAERLAAIGDNYMSRKEQEAAERGSSVSPRQAVSCKTGDMHGEKPIEATTLNPLECEIRDCLLGVADDIDARLADNARQAALRIAGHVTYSQFKNAVQDAAGNEIGLDQVAALLHITKRATHLAGAGGALALQIKEMSLKYFEDKFAGWIVGQGGWDTMLSDASEDELD